jgi:hypothetical protein
MGDYLRLADEAREEVDRIVAAIAEREERGERPPNVLRVENVRTGRPSSVRLSFDPTSEPRERQGHRSDLDGTSAYAPANTLRLPSRRSAELLSVRGHPTSAAMVGLGRSTVANAPQVAEPEPQPTPEDEPVAAPQPAHVVPAIEPDPSWRHNPRVWVSQRERSRWTSTFGLWDREF